MANRRYDEEDRDLYSGSVYDKQNFTLDELDAADRIRIAAENGETSWDAAHNYVEDIRAKYGYTGGKDGSGYTRLTSYAQPSYQDKYESAIDRLTDDYLSRRFSYDPQTDPIYQYYLDQYTRGGKQAMENMYGQLSARTGGLGSTAAVTASQNAYNDYMEAAADKIPELYKLAYDMYRQDNADKLAAINLLQGRSDTDYSRFNTDRNFDYGVWGDQRSYDTSERNAAINRVQNYFANGGRAADLNNELAGASGLSSSEFNAMQGAYDLAQKEKANADARDRVDNFLAAYGSVDALDPELIAASGYSAAELTALEKYYADQKNKSNKKSSGGSGSSRSSGSGSSAGSILDSMPDGMTENEAKVWLRINGGKMTEGAIKDYTAAYMAKQEDSQEEQAEDADITNRHGESWVEVGDTRYSYQELMDMVDSGKVTEEYDKDKNAYTYTIKKAK